MARTRTLLQLRTEIRDTADMQNSSYVADSELTRRINQSYARLYDLLLQADPEYNRQADTASTAALTDTTNLDAAFYKLHGVDVLFGSTYDQLLPLPDWTWRLRFQDTTGWRKGQQKYYSLEGTKIRWFPTPDAIHTVVMWITPNITDLSVDGDTLDGVNGYEDYIVFDCAIWARNKEEGEVQELLIERQRVEERIKRMARKRNRDRPTRPRDTRGRWRRRSLRERIEDAT